MVAYDTTGIVILYSCWQHYFSTSNGPEQHDVLFSQPVVVSSMSIRHSCQSVAYHRQSAIWKLVIIPQKVVCLSL